MTAFGDLSTAIRAVRQGAAEHVVKPFDLPTMRRVIQRALQCAAPAREASDPRRGASPPRQLDEFVGASPAMQEVFKQIALAADSDDSVLLLGESGVGKELAARAIHAHSARCGGPLVAVNVSALSPTLAEAELFGHTAGAFTGAAAARQGLLAAADGGALLLDEVAEMPLALQVKLLRCLDSGEVLPVGADRPVRVDLRVLSATHRDLEHEVRCGRFRHDLYFRLSAFPIRLPPLRHRREDIADLARHFAQDRRRATFSEDALSELARRPWHGNVRELRNAVRHALIVSRGGLILPEHLPAPLSQIADEPAIDQPARVAPEELADRLEQCAARLLAAPEATGTIYERYLQQVEPPLLRTALAAHHGQVAPAARALGIHRATLRKKLADLAPELPKSAGPGEDQPADRVAGGDAAAQRGRRP
jgi:two-component system nitrogen regulation response regulator GlnG